MRTYSLSTRLFFSFFAVAALLYGGIFFYLKSYSREREAQRAEQAFARAVSHYQDYHYGQPVEKLTASGLFHVLLRTEPKLETISTTLPLSSSDLSAVAHASGQGVPEVEISSGRFLVKAVSPGDNGRRLVVLFPLAEFERAASELSDAFLAAGLALLLAISVLSRILAHKISLPLITLRDKVRSLAASIGLEPGEEKGDEVRAIAQSFLDVVTEVQTAFDHKKLAIDELQAYKDELLRVNSNLHRRLFQVKVLLSLWSERDKALDVKDFLSRFLEAILPGVPFEYGCVIIRPIADMKSETIFAKKVDPAGSRPEAKPLEEESGKISTQWTDIIDPQVKEFLLRESEACLKVQTVTINSVTGCIRPGAPPTKITVLSLRLKQGEERLGSVHLLTEQPSPVIGEVLTDFLLNLSAQVAAQLQIQALSYATRIDPLTRLYNRGYLNDRLREELVRCARNKQSFSLLLLDIDYFKRVNEVHGRQAGDEVLRGVAALLKRSCRFSDAVCRFGGPILAIVLADTPAAGAKIFAENIRRSVANEEFPIPGGTLHITVSIGVAEYPTNGLGVEALVAQADHALMEAKAQGRKKAG